MYASDFGLESLQPWHRQRTAVRVGNQYAPDGNGKAIAVQSAQVPALAAGKTRLLGVLVDTR